GGSYMGMATTFELVANSMAPLNKVARTSLRILMGRSPFRFTRRPEVYGLVIEATDNPQRAGYGHRRRANPDTKDGSFVRRPTIIRGVAQMIPSRPVGDKPHSSVVKFLVVILREDAPWGPRGEPGTALA